jgi:predicted DNA-binding transcriptional regulator AlpA
MEDQIRYVRWKLMSGQWNISKVCKLTGISNPTVYKIINGNGDKVRPYIVTTLYDFFKKSGE